jgi:hypothetical protein
VGTVRHIHAGEFATEPRDRRRATTFLRDANVTGLDVSHVGDESTVLAPSTPDGRKSPQFTASAARSSLSRSQAAPV